MRFSRTVVERLYDALTTVEGKCEALAAADAGLRLRNDTARPFARAGIPAASIS